MITIAARTDSGRLANSGARTIAVARTSAAVMSDDELGPVARRLAGRRLAEAGVDREPTEQARSPRSTAPSAISSWSGSMS